MPGSSREAIRLVADDPELVDRLLRVFGQLIPPGEVFTPGLGLRALARAWRPGSRRTVAREFVESVAAEVRHARRPRHPAYRPVAAPEVVPAVG